MAELRRVPVYNRGSKVLQVGLEPEGDCIQLQPGDGLEIRYWVESDEPGIGLEVKGHLVSIHCMVTKEVWRKGERVR